MDACPSQKLCLSGSGNEADICHVKATLYGEHAPARTSTHQALGGKQRHEGVSSGDPQAYKDKLQKRKKLNSTREEFNSSQN